MTDEITKEFEWFIAENFSFGVPKDLKDFQAENLCMFNVHVRLFSIAIKLLGSFGVILLLMKGSIESLSFLISYIGSTNQDESIIQEMNSIGNDITKIGEHVGWTQTENKGFTR